MDVITGNHPVGVHFEPLVDVHHPEGVVVVAHVTNVKRDLLTAVPADLYKLAVSEDVERVSYKCCICRGMKCVHGLVRGGLIRRRMYYSFETAFVD